MMSTTFTYTYEVSYAHEQKVHAWCIVSTVHGHGYNGQQKDAIWPLWAMPDDSKHIQASLSLILTDWLCLRAAQVPRCRDLAIRPRGWAWFGQNLWLHQSFWLPHQRKRLYGGQLCWKGLGRTLILHAGCISGGGGRGWFRPPLGLTSPPPPLALDFGLGLGPWPWQLAFLYLIWCRPSSWVWICPPPLKFATIHLPLLSEILK